MLEFPKGGNQTQIGRQINTGLLLNIGIDKTKHMFYDRTVTDGLIGTFLLSLLLTKVYRYSSILKCVCLIGRRSPSILS